MVQISPEYDSVDWNEETNLNAKLRLTTLDREGDRVSDTDEDRGADGEEFDTDFCNAIGLSSLLEMINYNLLQRIPLWMCDHKTHKVTVEGKLNELKSEVLSLEKEKEILSYHLQKCTSQLSELRKLQVRKVDEEAAAEYSEQTIQLDRVRALESLGVCEGG